MVLISIEVKWMTLLIVQVSATETQLQRSSEGVSDELKTLESGYKSAENNKGVYVVSVDNEKHNSSKTFSYYNIPHPALPKEEPLVPNIDNITSIEDYDDYDVIYPEHDNPDYRRRKKRDFLTCWVEEPIIWMCRKSCINIFATFCYGYICPPGLRDQAEYDCKVNCLYNLKHLMRGEDYVEKP